MSHMDFVCPEHPGCAWRRVRAGQSLLDVAREAGVPPLRLLELNPYLDPTELVEGLPILVPVWTGHAGYGETPVDLARRSGLPVEVFLAMNPLLAGPGPLPGQRYRL